MLLLQIDSQLQVFVEGGRNVRLLFAKVWKFQVVLGLIGFIR